METLDSISLSFHHIGKPVSLSEIQYNPKTKYSPLFDMYSLDLDNSLSIPIELHAFGENCPLDPRIQKESHVAFKVSDIENAISGLEVIMPLYTPFAGYSCAMVMINDQLVELIETTLTESEIWGDGIYQDSILYPKGK